MKTKRFYSLFRSWSSLIETYANRKLLMMFQMELFWQNVKETLALRKILTNNLNTSGQVDKAVPSIL